MTTIGKELSFGEDIMLKWGISHKFHQSLTKHKPEFEQSKKIFGDSCRQLLKIRKTILREQEVLSDYSKLIATEISHEDVVAVLKLMFSEIDTFSDFKYDLWDLK